MQDGRDKKDRKNGPRLKGRAANRNENKKNRRFQRLAEMVGNDEIKERINRGNTTRDAMLEQLCERLKVMRELQIRELALTSRGAHWSWWRGAADNMKKTVQEPEPTRWNAAAHRYEEAAKALCRGDVSRGRKILENAMELEQRAQDTLTDLVDQADLAYEAASGSGVAGDDLSIAVAGPRDAPEGVDIAKEIYGVTKTVPDMPNRSRIKDPWWTRDEEEEEEGADGGGS